jgi:Cu(I)-responsive transcriptional regulator
MVRHYEQTGLLPPAERTESGYRLYGEREVSVLRFIRQSRRLGFSVPQIAELIGRWGDDRRTSREVKTIALRHLADLDEKLREIAEMKAGLEGLVRACAGDDHAHCAILDNLAAESPEAPRHVARFVKPRRRRLAPDDEAPRSARAAPASGHVDLMAWMQGVHTHQPGAGGKA